MDATLENLNVNWSVFSDEEARIVQKGIKNGAFNELINMLVSVSPEKAEEIAKIQAQMRPRSFVFESQAQKEFEVWMKNNPGAITPEIEAEWQAKIDVERNEALARMEDGRPKGAEKAPAVPGQAGTSLTEVPGLGEASISKLNSAGVFTTEELKLRPHEDLIKILNPLVAANVKKFFSTK